MARAQVFTASAVVLAVACAFAGCGSSTNTYTSPSSISKCAVRIGSPASPLPAGGGSGSLTITTERECQWTAQADAAWLAITAGGSGQGDGTVQFRAAENLDPVARTGSIVANEQRATVTQSAAECRFELGRTSASFSPEGGNGSVELRTSSALCSWTAASDASWVIITSASSGNGPATIGFSVASTSGDARSARLTIAGLPFLISQAEQCTHAVSPLAVSTGSAGGAASVTVTAADACPWTAASNVPWITVSTTSGTGGGTVAFTVAPTTGPPRTGTITVAGHLVTVTQSAGCSFDVAPLTHTVEAAGGTRTVNVTTASGCAWSASSSAPWIAVDSAGGNGPAAVTLTVEPTTGASRSGTLSIAGQTVTVIQGQGCTYAISPESQTVSAAGGTGTIAVAAGTGCGWTAISNAPWIKVTSGASGAGNGTVAFSVDVTSGPARSGTITVAGRTFTVNQGQGCTFSLSPASASAPAAASTGAFEVRTTDGCAWSAASGASWLTISAGATGAGTGTVRYSVAANAGPARTGTITAAGSTFTVAQAAGCSYSVSPTAHAVGRDGGTASSAVTAPGGCTWTATSGAEWIGISSGASGSGGGIVQLVIAPNPGAERQGTVAVAGQTITVTQASGCTYSIDPTSQAMPVEGGNGTFAVSAGATCAWTVTSNASWISASSDSNGAGSGIVQFSVTANLGGARTGTITAAGQTFTVTQAGSCAATVAPETFGVAAAGGSQEIAVTLPADCSWTASSSVAWIAVAPPASGSGPGAVRLDVAANSGPARSGTATVAGRTVTANQESGCTFAISPTSQSVAAAGGTGTVTVSTGASCPWTATSNAPWIVVTAGATGSGEGAVQFSVDVNQTGAERTGTITIAGQAFTVTQAGPGGGT